MDKLKNWIRNNILVSLGLAIILLSGLAGWVGYTFTPVKYKTEYLEDKKTREQLFKKEKEFNLFKDSVDRENNLIMEKLKKADEKLNISEIKEQKAISKIDIYVDRIAKGKVENDSLKASIKDVDSLRLNYELLKVELETQDLINSNIKTGYEKVIKNKDEEIERRSQLFSTMRSGYDVLYNNYQVLNKENIKLRRKQEKKFNVSIGAGVGIGKDLQPTPVIALTVNKTLIRF